MNEKQFDICLEFHLGLIRHKPLECTIEDAKFLLNKTDVSGFSSRRISSAQNIIDSLNDRMVSLVEWCSDNFSKESIYIGAGTRKPSAGAFVGAIDVMTKGTAIVRAAKDNKVNYQSIKVLIPRLKRWDEFAKRLHETF